MTLSKPSRARRQVLLAAASVAAAPAASFAQQSWPTRPVRMIVPYGAGNQADLVARALAELLGKRWGQPVIIENVAGAGVRSVLRRSRVPRQMATRSGWRRSRRSR